MGTLRRVVLPLFLACILGVHVAPVGAETEPGLRRHSTWACRGIGLAQASEPAARARWYADARVGGLAPPALARHPLPAAPVPDPPEPPPATTSRSAPPVPAWASDARWYHVVVPRFHNADPAKGPADGNLAGLAARLGYLKELGINALLLDTIFHPAAGKPAAIDPRHIDDRIGQPGSLSRVSGETASPGTWRFSESDVLFQSFVKTAHERGFHVAVAIDVDGVLRSLSQPGGFSDHWLAVTRRWLDPNGDGDPSDGIDGWVVAGVERAPRGFWPTWRAHAKKLNRNALLVVDVDKHAQPWLGQGGFDVAINREMGATIRRFFSSRTAAPLGTFVDDLVVAVKSHAAGTGNATLIAIDGPGLVRLRTLLTRSLRPSGTKTAAPESTGEDPALAPLRLATFLAQFSQGAPVTYYGDEVGMTSRLGADEPAPMWWPDIRQGATGIDAGYYPRLASLIRWLAARRDVDEPLRRGTFEKVMVDEARRIFAVGRSSSSRRVILVVNLSDTKQRVMLKIGTPTQIVTLLTPHLVPPGGGLKDAGPRTPGPARVAPLRMLASAQRVSDAGEIRLWVDPMLVRVLLIGGDEPK